MSARNRIALLVALVAAAAVVVVAAAALSSDGSSATADAEDIQPRPGRPPLSFALGFRKDQEARDLQRGAKLYQRGNGGAAAALFAKHDSLEAKVGAAFATWPDGTLDRMEQLAKLYPEHAVVQLHLGLVRLWAQEGDPLDAFEATAEAAPDTPYAVLAGNLLYPKFPAGLPSFIPSFPASKEVTRLPPHRQLAALRRRAARGEVRDILLYGVGLQRVGQPISAREAFEQAARRAPNDAEAQVARAVGLFDKASPDVAFSRLGPLTDTFPNEPTVRFHLGVLLLWTGRIALAEKQLKLASETRPGSPLANEAVRYLVTIRKAKG